MIPSPHPLPQHHIFVCTNEREGECCSGTDSFELFRALKQWSRTRLHNVWVTRTGCLGFCNPHGATVVIYPEKILLEQCTLTDIEKIKSYIEK